MPSDRWLRPAAIGLVPLFDDCDIVKVCDAVVKVTWVDEDGLAMELVASAFLVYLQVSFPKGLLVTSVMLDGLRDHLAEKFVTEKGEVVVHKRWLKCLWCLETAKLLLVSIPKLEDHEVTDEQDERLKQTQFSDATTIFPNIDSKYDITTRNVLDTGVDITAYL